MAKCSAITTMCKGLTMTFIRLAVLALLTASLSPAFAHSGGTDKQGCHVDHKTGQRHCH